MKRKLLLLLLFIAVVIFCLSFISLYRRNDRRKLDYLIEAINEHMLDPRPFTKFLHDYDCDLGKYHFVEGAAFKESDYTLAGAIALRCSDWEDWKDCDYYVRGALLRARDHPFTARDPFTLEALIREAKALRRPDLVASISSSDLQRLPSYLYVDFLIAKNQLDDALLATKKLVQQTTYYETEKERQVNVYYNVELNRRLAEVLWRMRKCEDLDREMDDLFNRDLCQGLTFEAAIEKLPKNLTQEQIQALDEFVFMSYYAMLCAKDANDQANFEKWSSRGEMMTRVIAHSVYANRWNKDFVVSLFSSQKKK